MTENEKTIKNSNMNQNPRRQNLVVNSHSHNYLVCNGNNYNYPASTVYHYSYVFYSY